MHEGKKNESRDYGTAGSGLYTSLWGEEALNSTSCSWHDFYPAYNSLAQNAYSGSKFKDWNWQ